MGANIYISHGSFLHPRNPALCVSVTHIPIDYLSTIALHHRGALYVRLLIRIRQHEIEGGRAWKGMIEMIAARAPTRFQGLTTTPSLLRFGDKPSFLSANSKHWSLSRPSLDCSPLSSPVCKRVKRCPSPLRGWVRSGVYRFSTPNDRSCQVVLYWPAGFYTSPLPIQLPWIIYRRITNVNDIGPN